MLIFSLICSLFINKKKNYTDNSRFYRALLRAWLKVIIFLCRIRLHITGSEFIPRDRKYVMVANHRSIFDPIVALRALEDDEIIFISKPENYKIPIVGSILIRCGFVSIDRESPRNSMRTVFDTAKLVKEEKFSVGVYPEGTRNHTDDPLIPFHNGMFKIAQMSAAPILVVATRNTEKVLKNALRRGTDVYLNIAGLIPPEEIVGRPTAEIGEKVREMMLETLERGD
ncbi:MAG: lysophospholipid acyltransferase family protein [Lachnospiraceae bacterium]|jgi:1-acyl-sn-glycerol-3-phosphate acyltransferase